MNQRKSADLRRDAWGYTAVILRLLVRGLWAAGEFHCKPAYYYAMPEYKIQQWARVYDVTKGKGQVRVIKTAFAFLLAIYSSRHPVSPSLSAIFRAPSSA